jgi:hypothetical protein
MSLRSSDGDLDFAAGGSAEGVAPTLTLMSMIFVGFFLYVQYSAKGVLFSEIKIATTF